MRAPRQAATIAAHQTELKSRTVATGMSTHIASLIQV